MKKIVLILFLLICFLGIGFASEADRQVSDYVSNPNKEQIKSGAGEIFGVTMIATAAAGWVALYDVSSASEITASKEPKIEIMQATQYNTAIKDFPEGFNFYNGIYADGSNVKAVIYYR